MAGRRPRVTVVDRCPGMLRGANKSSAVVDRVGPTSPLITID
jgi:hypothetical protein